MRSQLLRKLFIKLRQMLYTPAALKAIDFYSLTKWGLVQWIIRFEARHKVGFRNKMKGNNLKNNFSMILNQQFLSTLVTNLPTKFEIISLDTLARFKSKKTGGVLCCGKWNILISCTCHLHDAIYLFQDLEYTSRNVLVVRPPTIPL